MAILEADRVVTRLRSAFNHDTDRTGLLQMAADLIREAGAPYTSVYMYMLHGDMLELEAYSGRETEHDRIPVGKGVCGTAVATGEDQNVGDVQGRENYIACKVSWAPWRNDSSTPSPRSGPGRSWVRRCWSSFP